MSLPEFSTGASPSREDAINQIISSIAMEEISLSHIINAEGEKLQYILGTIPGVSGPGATIEDVLKINESVQAVLQHASEVQTLLKSKLHDALSSAVLTGPTGPPGPVGPASPVEIFGIQAKLLNHPNSDIADDAPIIFDTVSEQIGTGISYNETTGVFTISQNGYYLASWWVALDGSTITTGANFSLNVNGISHSTGASPIVTGQLSGSALVVVDAGPVTITLTNESGEPMNLEDVYAQANITILAIPMPV